jgi:hypothetical protein
MAQIDHTKMAGTNNNRGVSHNFLLTKMRDYAYDDADHHESNAPR